MNKFFHHSILSCLVISLCGCATIVSKSNWPVTISSNPEGAKVTIYNKSGMAIHTGETPMTVVLDSSRGFFTPARYQIVMSKPGCVPHTGVIKGKINPWYAGNLIFGGLIGILIVDPATGAMWKMPDTYIGSLPTKVAAAHKPGNLTILSMADVPAHLRSTLTRVQ